MELLVMWQGEMIEPENWCQTGGRGKAGLEQPGWNSVFRALPGENRAASGNCSSPVRLSSHFITEQPVPG